MGVSVLVSLHCDQNGCGNVVSRESHGGESFPQMLVDMGMSNPYWLISLHGKLTLAHCPAHNRPSAGPYQAAPYQAMPDLVDVERVTVTGIG